MAMRMDTIQALREARCLFMLFLAGVSQWVAIGLSMVRPRR